MANYLLEIGMEEIPARFLKDLSLQLEEKIADYLKESQITFQTIESFASPRRLAVRVNQISEKQADTREKVKGPSLKIAKDDQGQWSKAALGFLKGQGASVDDIIVEPVKGEDYIFIDKFIAGKSVQELLMNLNQVLKALNVPVSMRWNVMEESFIRPVHWMVSLLDDQVIPLNFLKVEAGRKSLGHRFLGNSVDIPHANDYEEKLKAEFVLVDFNERQEMIRQQIIAIEQDMNWEVPIDQDLLEEVTSIVEWPQAFYGQFDPSYLEIPDVISITAMRDHQRYFYVLDPTSQKLLPYFISVRNGNNHAIENVVRGNLKVLRARLEDALFFYKEDLKQPLTYYSDKLSLVKEHFKLGSYADKQKRITKALDIVHELLPEISETDLYIVKRAGQIYKFDLMTNTVDEFSELQGMIGQIYAEEYGETLEVAQAIGSQYLPSYSGGPLPETIPGSVLAMMDKLDTIYHYFEVGMIPTGSNDPYALRRQAMGIVEIVLDRNWDFDMKELIEKLVILEGQSLSIALLDQVIDFLKARLVQHLSKDDIDHDIIESVSMTEGLNIYNIYQSGHRLQNIKVDNPDQYRKVVENMTRIVNLGGQIKTDEKIDMEVIESDSELQLVQFINMIKPTQDIRIIFEQFNEALSTIENYFDNNMVHHEDEAIKKNRLLTMGHLSQYILNVFDPSKLISKF